MTNWNKFAGVDFKTWVFGGVTHLHCRKWILWQSCLILNFLLGKGALVKANNHIQAKKGVQW